MNVLVTIGPTQEPLDAMRILSNRSTGKLGTQLALTLAEAGHRVIALRGSGSTFAPTPLMEQGIEVIPFTTTKDLHALLEKTSKSEQIDALFHAAAVSDFYFPNGSLDKIPSDRGPITLTLESTPKLLSLLRGWFPLARLVGWKFEASGDKESALAAARAQILKNKTDACVLNGPSYGEGFGILHSKGEFHNLPDREALCKLLRDFLDG
jgi:phosphopantothenoylcysteine decarboxylase/phosphopantothenate--cysteine ligase